MCDHYKRNCHIIAPCCNKEYACRICHDIKEDSEQMDYKKAHKIDRFKISEILCIKCNTKQKKSNKCINCEIQFASYYCEICCLYNDDENKKMSHCDKCGICRIGCKEELYHCDNCGICVPSKKEDHECFIKNIHSNCPVCLEDLFNSVKSARFLKCGHSMHLECLIEYSKTNYKCPLCNVSMVNVNNIIENEVNNTPMPEELQIDTNILCNDCNKKSIAKFHIVAMKCEHCNSYNTVRV